MSNDLVATTALVLLGLIVVAVLAFYVLYYVVVFFFVGVVALLLVLAFGDTKNRGAPQEAQQLTPVPTPTYSLSPQEYRRITQTRRLIDGHVYYTLPSGCVSLNPACCITNPNAPNICSLRHD